MYTLRVIEERRNNESECFDQVIKNFELGNFYEVNRRGTTEMFDYRIKMLFNDADNQIVRALVIGQNEETYQLLESTKLVAYTYYIMTSDGKTFEKL